MLNTARNRTLKSVDRHTNSDVYTLGVVGDFAATSNLNFTI